MGASRPPGAVEPRARGRLERMPWLANLALALTSIALMSLALEVGLRVRAHLENRGLLGGGAIARGVEIPADGPAELGHMIRLASDPDVVYELKPDLSVLYQGARVTTNAEGFRTHDTRRATPMDALCILGIGDSFMFGQGVPGADTYLAVLEARLADQHPDRAFRIVNTAVPGYNTVMEVATLEAKGLAHGPRVVVVEFVGNDLTLPNFVGEPRRPWSLRRSHLGDFVKERLGVRGDRSLFRQLLDAGLRGIPQESTDELGNTADPSLVPPSYRRLVGWSAYETAMRKLQDLSRRHGFEVVSISLAPRDAPLKTRALDLSETLGFHVLDVGVAFRDSLEANGHDSYLESPLALHPDDGHPSILAHRIAGELLADFIEQEVLP